MTETQETHLAEWGGPEAIWREPPRGSAWDPATIALPGLDRLRAWIRGEMPPTPIELLTGIVPVEAGVGTMTLAMPASEWIMAGSRFYLGGSLALLADAALGCAIITGLPQGVALTTQELSMHFLRVASPDSRRLTARGHIIHGGRFIGLSEVHIHDADGRLIAYGSSRCVMVDVPLPAAVPRLAGREPDPAGWLPPTQRELKGAVTTREALAAMSGQELVEGWSDGTLPLPPIGHLFGMRPTGGKHGVATAEMPASGWLTNAAGTVYGGALALLADFALTFAATSSLAPGTSFRTLDLKVNYLRPVRPDGRLMTAQGRVIHSGKRLIVADSEVLDADGRQVVVATGTQMLSPEPWTY